MSDSDKQEVLLMAIEYLKIQYDSLQNPCIALYISQYRVETARDGVKQLSGASERIQTSDLSLRSANLLT